MSGEAEAEPYVRIEFNCQLTEHGTVTLHSADCATTLKIKALKEDLESVFGLTESEQEWYLRDRPLRNDSTLEEHGLVTSNERRPAKIHVKKCTKHL